MNHRLIFVAIIALNLLPLNAFCDAEVVDYSENFALLEEQQAEQLPVASDDKYSNSPEQTPALAREDKDFASNSSNTSLLNKIQGLQQDIQELRGQLDVQAHDLKLLQEQQLSFYKDLDARLRGAQPANTIKTPTTELSVSPATATTIIPATNPAATVVTPVVAINHTNPAEEQISYLAAYDLIKNKQFNGALTAMQTFIVKYPHGGYTANAHYWLGELYMTKHEYPEAIEHFNIVMQEFPSSSKSSASLLKIGYALASSGDIAHARVKLQEVIKKYPDTSTAKLAIAKLNALKSL